MYKRKKKSMMTIHTKIIDEKIYYIHYCIECNNEMPYSQKCNFYHSKKIGKRCQSCANPMKKPEIAAKFKGDLNPSKRKEFRKWMSNNNPMYRKEVIKKHKIACNEPLRRENIKQRMLKNNPCKDPKIIEKRTNTYTKKLAEGLYTIKNNWKTGYYNRINGLKEWYDSSYELKKMEEYDKLKINWTKKHKIRIPYINLQGMKTYYVPDFFINENTIEEIKGWMKPNDEIKALVAINFCKNKKWSYHLYIGKELKLSPKYSYDYKE